MSVQPITPIKGSSGSSTPSIQSDPQVHQLESQIKDWSTCPTTPPAIKKQIVDKLQTQLDSVEKGLENHAKNAQASQQAAAPDAAKPFRSLFKVDTYA